MRAALTYRPALRRSRGQRDVPLIKPNHHGVAPIKEIRLISGVNVAQAPRPGSGQAANHAVVVPFPLDYGVWTLNAETVTKDVKAKAKQAGWNGKLELWVTGTLSPLAKENLGRMGIGFAEKVADRIEYQY